ncbi:unnamed protein product [Porites evermanni]|uniref:Uncharacterized protein n=1 Tax=Porites evermanni TaxID=104178 RepID=A0ABN8MEG2_9CNID|nr:unnamed protein product [Porites evermanni]
MSVNYRFDPQNRRLPKGRWTKVNTRPVCFGTRKNQFGRFYVRRGRLIAIKLVHRYGSVTCNINDVNSPLSNWGCGMIPGYNSFSPRLVLRFFPSPFPVLRGRELRLWYGEDLMDLGEEDNRGSSCVDVFALYA